MGGFQILIVVFIVGFVENPRVSSFVALAGVVVDGRHRFPLPRQIVAGGLLLQELLILPVKAV